MFDSINQSAWKGLALVLAVQGDVTEAADVWKMLGQIDPIFAASASNVLELVKHEREAVALWHAVGNMGQVFISIGDKASRGYSFNTVEMWYQRAADAEPDLADTWFSLGWLYERHGRAEDADSAYQRATLSSKFRAIGQSSAFCRRGKVYLDVSVPTRLDAALAMFQVAVDLNDFGTEQEAADCYFYKAEALSRIGMDAHLKEIVAACERAIDYDSQHVFARVMLGVAYDKLGRITDAEKEFETAIEIAPEYCWSYYYLAQLREKTGEVGEAITLYKQALLINPQLAAAETRLAALQGFHKR